MTASRRFSIPIHPFLFASFPILTFLAENLGEVLPIASLRILLASLILVIAYLFIFWLLLRRVQQSAVLASVLALLSLSYGHLYATLDSLHLLGNGLGRHRFLLPLSSLLFVAVFFFVRHRDSVPLLTKYMNATAIIVVMFPMLQIIMFFIRIRPIPLEYASSPAIPVETTNASMRDIYYIILDEYPRADVLADSYSYDNTPFLSDLEQVGFSIAERSRSNYAQTELSLASSLNYAYLDDLLPNLDPMSDDRSSLWRLIQENAVMAFFGELGYTTVAFETGYSWSQLEQADVYLGPSQGVGNTSVWGLTDFEVLFLRKTALLALYDARLALPEYLTPELERPARRSYERTTLALEEMRRIQDLDGPHFVFAHLLVPHPPYVYSEDGEYIGDQYGLDGTLGDEEALYSHNGAGHRRSIAYINGEVLDLVSHLISGSDEDPIIILQADHGVPFSSHPDRMAIFNAFYLPGGGAELVYADITPVNTFRVILSHYYGANLPILEDVSYFSSYDKPYDFEVVE